MKFTSRKINFFILFKLPSAYLCGVRVKFISEQKSVVFVKHKWINQNPFKSMFWAVQAMAAELSTGILVMQAINMSNRNISMLLINMNATFTKKATGKITFECNDGQSIKEVIKKSVKPGEGHTILVTSEGVNQEGVTVSKYEFEWSLMLKK